MLGARRHRHSSRSAWMTMATAASQSCAAGSGAMDPMTAPGIAWQPSASMCESAPRLGPGLQWAIRWRCRSGQQNSLRLGRIRCPRCSQDSAAHQSLSLATDSDFASSGALPPDRDVQQAQHFRRPSCMAGAPGRHPCLRVVRVRAARAQAKSDRSPLSPHAADGLRRAVTLLATSESAGA